MPPIIEDQERRIIPRWRSFDATLRTGELQSVQNSLGRNVYSYEGVYTRLREWEDNKSLPFATDFISEAFAFNKGDIAKEAAEFVLKHPNSSGIAREIAQKLLGQNGESEQKVTSSDLITIEKCRSEIRILRHRLSSEPRNAILYVDVARYYTILGQTDKAERMMNVALKIAGNNRFIVRSAVRLYLHMHDVDRASRVLRTTLATASDPWLLATDISVGLLANRTSRHAKRGLDIVTNALFQPRSISELASALATLEFSHGANKKARKLFTRSLIDPTENTVAQVAWAERNDLGLNLEEKLFQTPNSYEARTWKSFFESKWENSLSEALAWLSDQPFSGWPALLAGYLCTSILEDHDKGIQILQESLRTNPEDASILNNLTVGLASTGRVNEAIQTFKRIKRDSAEESSQIAFKATEGLLMFRQGEALTGRTLYLHAIEEAKRKKLAIYVARALVMLAREELRINSPFAASTVEAAKEAALKVPDRPDVKEMINRLRNAIEKVR